MSSASSPPSFDEADRYLGMIEAALKAYTSHAWWDAHGSEMVASVRRYLKARQIQEKFASEGEGVTERERFELWWDDPDNADGGVVAATAWAAWKAALDLQKAD